MTPHQFSNRWFKGVHSLQWLAFAYFLSPSTTQAHYAPLPTASGGYHLAWQAPTPEPIDGPDWSDYDVDGLPAWCETWLGTDPVLYDTDYDGINDRDELFTTGTNPLDWDSDGNGQIDLADFYAAHPPAAPLGSIGEEGPAEEGSTDAGSPSLTDTDSDGLTDEFETTQSATNPGLSDTDGNGRSDYDDYYYPVHNPDSDSDGVLDSTETTQGTDPASVDTDNDGLTDGEETNIYGTDPNNAHSRSTQYTDWYMVDTTDSDGGGIPDRIETHLGMNPADATDDTSGDLDGDGESNVQEYNGGQSPDSNVTESYDRDGDGMTDVWEIANGLNPDDASDGGSDPDGDGVSTLIELQQGTNPSVADVASSENTSTGTTENEANPELNLGGDRITAQEVRDWAELAKDVLDWLGDLFSVEPSLEERQEEIERRQAEEEAAAREAERQRRAAEAEAAANASGSEGGGSPSSQD